MKSKQQSNADTEQQPGPAEQQGQQPPDTQQRQTTQDAQEQNTGPHGYPEGTPLEQMNEAERTAYWRHRSRQHEDRWKQVIDRNLTPDQILEMQQQLDDAQRKQMSDHEKQVDDARKEASSDARAALMPGLVLARIEAAVARRNPTMSDDDIHTRVQFLDLTKFLTSKGEVDADMVSNYAATLTPAKAIEQENGKKFPDMGGGKRGPITESAKARADQVAIRRGWVKHA